jgi:hypothetical protein
MAGAKSITFSQFHTEQHGIKMRYMGLLTCFLPGVVLQYSGFITRLEYFDISFSPDMEFQTQINRRFL